MRALLLAAGLGTRLRPLTDTVPKAMVDIAGRPLLDRWLEMLFEGGIERVLVNTHYLGPVIQGFVRSSAWNGSVDLVDETVLLGTGGTLLANRAWFGEISLLVTHGDNASDLDVAAFIKAHAGRPRHVLATMALFRTDHPQSCGIVYEIRDALLLGRRPVRRGAAGARGAFDLIAFENAGVLLPVCTPGDLRTTNLGVGDWR